MNFLRTWAKAPTDWKSWCFSDVALIKMLPTFWSWGSWVEVNRPRKTWTEKPVADCNYLKMVMSGKNMVKNLSGTSANSGATTSAKGPNAMRRRELNGQRLSQEIYELCTKGLTITAPPCKINPGHHNLVHPARVPTNITYSIKCLETTHLLITGVLAIKNSIYQRII